MDIDKMVNHKNSQTFGYNQTSNISNYIRRGAGHNAGTVGSFSQFMGKRWSDYW